MGENTAFRDEISVVLVDDAGRQVLMPGGDGDQLLPVPKDSVTLAGIRRAAKRVREEQRTRNAVAIAEATIGREEPQQKSCAV